MKSKKLSPTEPLFNLYQKIISPILHFLTNNLLGDNNHCRFTPTCSEYAKISYRRFNFFKASYLSLTRLLRCNPFFPGGYDPVPDDKI